MKKIIYYVACSIDGFIAGSDDDVSKFIFQGKAVERYQEDLKHFQTVIMGRNTYEFGYRFGAVQGQPSPAYPHMKHYIFSDHLILHDKSDQVEVKSLDIEAVNNIQKNSPTDIYLCGGGQFAGWLLENGLIDILKLKLNPIVLGGGIPLFGNSEVSVGLKLMDSKKYDEGIQLLDYKLEY